MIKTQTLIIKLIPNIFSSCSQYYHDYTQHNNVYNNGNNVYKAAYFCVDILVSTS